MIPTLFTSQNFTVASWQDVAAILPTGLDTLAGLLAFAALAMMAIAWLTAAPKRSCPAARL